MHAQNLREKGYGIFPIPRIPYLLADETRERQTIEDADEVIPETDSVEVMVTVSKPSVDSTRDSQT